MKPKATVPVMLRLDPADWKQFQKEAAKIDLRPAQLMRQLMREFLSDTNFYMPKSEAK